MVFFNFLVVVQHKMSHLRRFKNINSHINYKGVALTEYSGIDYRRYINLFLVLNFY